MRGVLLLISLLSLVGCSHHGTVAAAPMPAVAGPSFLNEEQGVRYTRQQMDKLAPTISFRLSGTDVYNRARNIADQMLKAGLAVSFTIRTRGDEVVLQPVYSDGEVMLRALKRPGVRACLSAEQQRALRHAENVVRDVCARHRSEYDRALAMHDYLVLNSEYKDSLNGHDTANATALLLNTGKGVCDSYTRAYRLMLTIAGIENRFVAGEANGDSHCWNLVRVDGAWVHVDCTYSDPKPDAEGRIYHTHFALTDSMIASDHVWNRSLYPAATSTALYYPYRHRAFESMYDLVSWARRQNRNTPGLYITAYVDELRVMGSDDQTARRLIEDAHEEVNEHVIAYYALEKCLPGVICVKVKN